MKFEIKNENDTRKFGLALAEILQPGDCVALTGDLGTGKTTLTKYIAEGLGIRGRITSPTFTIVQEYRDGRVPLFHFDLYRVNDPDELFEAGMDEYLYADGVSVVEWADLCPEVLPPGCIDIRITYGQADGTRVYEVSGDGGRLSGAL